MTKTRAYRDGELLKEDFPMADVSDFLAEPDTAVWVDLCAPSEGDLAELADELGLHRLAVEDAVQEHQRPKLDRYDGHAFLTVYAVRFDAARLAAEHAEALRELRTTVRETQLNLQSDRQNLIMKKVTGWAAVIAVPTAVTGFYGQNVAYPGNGTTAGFWVSTAVVLVLSVGLCLLFKKRDWLCLRRRFAAPDELPAALVV